MIAARTSSQVLTLSVDSSLGTKLLPTVLSLVAGSVPLAPMLSVPVFIAVLAAARLLASGLEAFGIASLKPFLALQLLLLVGFFLLCADAGAAIEPDGGRAIVAGMLGVAAMAVQNALVQMSLRGAPATAVMTSSITRFVMDLGTVLFGDNRDEIASARRRAQHAWPAILGFAAGCALGAAAQAAIGLQSLALPVGFALLAFLLSVQPDRAGHP